jgi:hypothetical protein
MDYTNISLEKVEKIYAEYKTLEQQERKLFLQKVVGKDFAIVQSIRIIPVKNIPKDLRSLVLKEDID